MNGPLKSVVANGARKQVAKKARQQHYPAPYAIIDLWQKHDGNALAAPEVEDRIISSPTARNLVRVFGLQERLKGFGKDADFKARRHDRNVAGPDTGTHRSGAQAGPGPVC